MELELSQILKDTWKVLAASAHGSALAERVLILATVDGVRPRTRTVILRGVDASHRQVSVHTDARSPKIAHLRANPHVSLARFDAASGTQVLLSGTAELHMDDPVARATWHQLPPDNRVDYMGAVAPGTRLDAPGSPPGDNSSRSAYQNFCVIMVTVEEIDWYRLGEPEHYRAHFKFSEEAWHLRWVAP